MNDPIVIITMDDESDEFLGEKFPYTYSTHVKFIEKLIKHRPLIINYLLNLNDPDSPEEMIQQKKFKNAILDFKESHGYFHFGTNMDNWGEELPPESLRVLGYSLALLHIDSNIFSKDEVCRRGILNISGDDSLHLWSANTFLKEQGKKPIENKSHKGAYYLSEADATFTLFRYENSPLERDQELVKISYHKVLEGNYPPELFKNKIILIGPQYNSRSFDYIFTPFNNEEKDLTPKLNVHGLFIKSLIDDKTIFPVPKEITHFVSFLLVFLLSYIISKVKPSKGLLITLAIMSGIILMSYLLFIFFSLWVYMTHLILTIFIVYYIWVPFRAIAEYQSRFTIEEESKILKKLEHLKQNFISLIGHDLKTPVAKIAGLADNLIHQYHNDSHQKKHLQSIIDATNELNKFILSILDLTKIESEKLKLHKVSKDLNQLIESVLGNLKFEAQVKKIELQKDLSPLYPINIDTELIKRVISNLVENAIKYSGEGTNIFIKTWDDSQWVYLEIKDQGPGIKQENLLHIFDKFYRVHNDAAHEIKGVGLGLYLVKYFVELHEGFIEVQSRIGEGTIFTVKLRNQ